MRIEPRYAMGTRAYRSTAEIAASSGRIETEIVTFRSQQDGKDSPQLIYSSR